MSSTTTNSRYGYVAENLRERGYCWERMEFQKVKLESQKISFESEWRQFRNCVSKITRLSFPVESEHTKYKSPWEKYFQHVVNPAGYGSTDSRLHENEHTFSNILFEALRTSLHDFVEPNVFGRNCIVLKNSHIGFGKGIDGAKLGFKGGYVHSRDGRSQHGCFVFGAKTKHIESSDAAVKANEIDVQHFEDDMTAAVVVQQDTRMFFMRKEDSESSDDDSESVYWELPRSLWGQALVYSRDIWRCLARRGVNVKSVPMVILAGKTDRTGSPHICCLDAHLKIPKYCTHTFWCRIDRIVNIDGTVMIPDQKDSSRNTSVSDVGSSMLSSSSSSDKLALAIYIKTLRVGLERAFEISKNRDKLAIAIYIKTLRVGPERAFEISKNRDTSNTRHSPISLLCSNLLKTNIDARLVASPIPNANPFRDSDLKIHHGELFSLVSPTKDHFSQLRHLYWFVDTECHELLVKKCLVKVTSVSVHRTYVRHNYSDAALSELQRACVENEALKRELAKVLLGYRTFDFVSIFMVMKDLRDEYFQVLDHQKIRQEGMLPALWTAFSVMVKALLLPMARHDVVHVDIRSTAQFTYNILCRIGGANDIELRLIDLDSLCRCSWIIVDAPARQDYSVHWLDIKSADRRRETIPALHYLFWQILWIAYTWYPRSVPKFSRETIPKLRTAGHLVRCLWRRQHFVKFKKWLGRDTAETLKSLVDEVFTEASVLATLDALGGVFCGSPSDPKICP